MANPHQPGVRDTAYAAHSYQLARGSDSLQAPRQAHGLLYGVLQRESATTAFADAFRLLTVVYLGAAPQVFFMK